MWVEPQFTSYYLGDFNGMHIFKRKKMPRKFWLYIVFKMLKLKKFRKQV